MTSAQSLSLRPDTRLTAAIMSAALAMVIALAAIAGAFRPAENQIEEIAFALLSRPASGQIHVVDMDAASMAAIRRWPWSRDHYARLVEQLDRAGARSISFDVDFSSKGDAAGDRAFAEAIAAARAPVALATFAQTASSDDGRQLDSLPIPALREQALLASVSVKPDPDGLFRRLLLGTVTGATARPSISALVAGRAGAADEYYPIDFAIDPATIPRHSFIAVENGLVPPASLKGKDVVIGASAVELSDQYAVPRYGMTPGVVIHALGAETLASGVPVYASWDLPLALAAALAFAVLGAQKRRLALWQAGGAIVMLIVVWNLARLAGGYWFEIVPSLLLLSLAGAVRYITLTQRLAAQGRQIDAASGLPNQLGLDARPQDAADRFVIAAQIDDFDTLKLAVENGSESLGALLHRIAERVKVATGGCVVYRTEDRTLAWVSSLPMDELEAQLAGIRAIMRSPFELDGRRLGVSLTFGVADYSGRDCATHAAHAASLAKKAGKVWRLHAADASEAASQQFSLLGELEEALRNGSIAVLYQPKLNLKTQAIDSVEALVRWNHPERGLLPPDCFIPLFEEAGRIDDLTLAVMSQSFADMRGWCDRGLTIGAAVNVSATLLTSESFAHRALALIERAGVPAHRITLEVTETAQFEDVDKAIATLERFRATGIRISMDDYGTGQSALNYLKLLPLSELKIDRMFVAHAHVDRGDAMLVRSTVQLAHELGLKVVAEGVEEPECLAFLRELGCDYAQGYLVGRPLKADVLAETAAASVAAAPTAQAA